MASRARPTLSEIGEAKHLAESNGLRLIGYEKRPDGTVRLLFGDPEESDNGHWFKGSPLYGDDAR